MGAFCSAPEKRTARKRHRCLWCGEAILPGSTYSRYFWSDGGDAGDVKMHGECLLASLVEAAEEGPGYEFMAYDHERPVLPELTGGAAVVASLVASRMHYALTPDQAQQLWGECRAHLERVGLMETVVEVERCHRPEGLGTLPRGDVLESLGQVIAGSSWPINSHSAEDCKRFAEGLVAGIKRRGYARMAGAPAPTQAVAT